MRKVFSVAVMAALACLVGLSKVASANVTYSLVWTATSGAGIGVGTNALVGVVGGDTLTLAIRMTTDQTMDAHGISLNFDTNPISNELNFFSPSTVQATTEWKGFNYGTTAMASQYNPINQGTGSPNPVESDGVVAGNVWLIESGKTLSSPLFLPVGTYTIGTVKFVANGTAQSNLELGYFSASDGTIGNDLLPVPLGNLSFGAGSVNAVIPEPATASLLGLGLVGLILAGRRARR